MDRPRDLDDPGLAVVDPQFGMDRSLRESHGRGSLLDGIGHGLLRLFGQARRRYVYRLFEKGSFQGIGLVEKGEHAQASAVQQPLQGNLLAGHIGFHHDAAGVGIKARRPVRGAFEYAADPAERYDEAVRRVGPDYAPAAR